MGPTAIQNANATQTARGLVSHKAAGLDNHHHKAAGRGKQHRNRPQADGNHHRGNSSSRVHKTQFGTSKHNGVFSKKQTPPKTRNAHPVRIG
jgi:hypothetical protein